MYTRFHVQERFSWLSFVICILKSTFRYLNTNISLLFTGDILHLDSFHFSDLARSRDNVKRALLQFQIRGVLIFTHYQYFWVLPWKYAVAICRWNLPQFFAVGIGRSYLPREFAVAICRGNLPQLFAVAILFFFSSLFYVDTDFLFINLQKVLWI